VGISSKTRENQPRSSLLRRRGWKILQNSLIGWVIKKCKKKK